MQVPFFLPSGYGVAEGNGAKAPSPMKGLLSGAKRQPRSITRRFEKKGAAPRDLWQIAGVWSCRRQRGESPKPDEKVVNKLFFCA